MKFWETTIQLIKYFNTNSKNNFSLMRTLKGESIFETFKNVSEFQKVSKFGKEIKYITKGLNKKEKNEQKQTVKEYKKLFKYIKFQPKEKRKELITKFRKSVYGIYLKNKENKGKNITPLNHVFFEYPEYRDKIKNVSFFAVRAAAGCLFNIDDITDAKKELGNAAMTEEIAKSCLMGSVGLGLLGKGSLLARNLTATAALYLPKGGAFVSKIGVIGATAAAFSTKPILDSIWQTEYENFLQKNNAN